MGTVLKLSALALREAAGGAAEAIGFKAGGVVAERVIDFLVVRFTDQSLRLNEALQRANERAWKSLEIALAGESLWERCQVALARGEASRLGDRPIERHRARGLHGQAIVTRLAVDIVQRQRQPPAIVGRQEARQHDVGAHRVADI